MEDTSETNDTSETKSTSEMSAMSNSEKTDDELSDTLVRILSFALQSRQHSCTIMTIIHI